MPSLKLDQRGEPGRRDFSCFNMSVASVINLEQPAAAQRRQLAELSRQLFVGPPLVRRKLQHYRPYLCPFDRLFQHVAPSARVLDVGCGSGLFLGLLAAVGKGIRGIGFDSSAPAIAAASKMATRVGPAGADSTLEFVRLDVNDPWPAGEFDVVSIIDVMHHVPPEHQRGLFSTAVKAVTPGGKLIYKDMCRRPLWRAWANRVS